MDTGDRLLLVVGVDGSAAGDRAVAWAVRIGRRLGATVELVTAWTASHRITGGPPVMPLADEESARRVQAEAVARVLPGAAVTALATTVAEGPPGPVLAEAARRADLLVVGSHGHRRFYSALMGSTSEHCIRHAGCPVVVVPSSAPEPDDDDIVVVPRD